MDELVDEQPHPAEPSTRRRLVARWFVRPAALEAVVLVWFAVEAWRAKWISDDGYIYLAYVDRVLDGHGAVFNPGEHVEAYTSVAWFCILTVLGAVVRFASVETTTLLVSLASSIVALAVFASTEREAARARGVRRHLGALDLPLVVVGGTYVFTSFATSGLETPLLLLWLSLVAREVWAADRRPSALAVLAGVGPLVRPDLAIVAAMVAVLAWRASSGRGRWWTVAIVAIPTLISSAVRIGLYGQLVPNTVYAKTATGHGWSDGIAYLRDSAGPYRLYWQAVAAVLVVTLPPVVRLARGARPSAAVDPVAWRGAWLLTAAAITTVQVLVVGGDFMHGRFWITPWVLALATLFGVGSLAVDRLVDRFGARFGARFGVIAGADRSGAAGLVIGLAIGLPLLLAVSQATSDQRRTAADEFFQIGDITDEQAYYLSVNAALHDLTPDNEFFLFRRGRALSELSARIDDELGISAGAIGQLAYAGATGPGDVFVYDLVGLTRPDVSRLAVAGDPRVGHARTAPDAMVMTHPRVDFHDVSAFGGFTEAFTVTIGDQRLVLVDPDLIDDLRDAGVVDAAAARRMTEHLHAAIAGPEVDANFLTFLRERSTEDAVVTARLAELAEVERSSSWRRWLDATADERALLAVDGCRRWNWFACLELAVDRHRAAQYPVELVQPDLRTVGG